MCPLLDIQTSSPKGGAGEAMRFLGHVLLYSLMPLLHCGPPSFGMLRAFFLQLVKHSRVMDLVAGRRGW